MLSARAAGRPVSVEPAVLSQHEGHGARAASLRLSTPDRQTSRRGSGLRPPLSATPGLGEMSRARKADGGLLLTPQ